MTDGPEWAPILDATKKVPGKGSKSTRVSLQEIQESEDFRRERTGADTAVALGAVDTGDDFDGWGWITQNASQAVTGFQTLLNNIVRGWKGIPDAVGSLEDVEVVLGAARQVQFGLITLADLQNAPDNAPFWESPNPFEDVSFPRRDLQPVITPSVTASMSSSGTTLTPSAWSPGLQPSALNAHVHNISTTATRPLFTIPSGTLALSAVRIRKDRIVNMVRFVAGGDTPAGDLLVGLYQIDVATGNMTLAYDFGDVSGEVDTGSLIYECALEMTEDMVLDTGSLYAVGILPLSGSFTVAGVRRQRIVPDPIIYPQGATELLSGQTALPSTITETALNHDSTHCVWVAIGQTVPTTINPVTLIITFDAYADNANWASPAVKNFGTGSSVWRISDGVLQCSGPSTLGGTNYRKAFIPLQRCATDDMYSEVVFGSGWPSEGTATRCYVRCNAEGTSGVSMEVVQTGSGDATVTIATVTDMVSSGTVRATSSGSFQAGIGDTFRIEAVTDPDTDFPTFTCYRNGDPIPDAVWVDSTGITDVGVAWRRAGYGATAQSFSFSVFRAAGSDVWRAGDLALTS